MFVEVDASFELRKEVAWHEWETKSRRLGEVVVSPSVPIPEISRPTCLEKSTTRLGELLSVIDSIGVN
jgi:hypothetical protein